MVTSPAFLDTLEVDGEMDAPLFKIVGCCSGRVTQQEERIVTFLKPNHVGPVLSCARNGDPLLAPTT